ncbi:uncharacterized protein F4812DRAFT_106113 [Daldinia caldariorum]|uniref:uncharacterized protein n=1 Tax=Daldinia caldariorum TaxID=326644 RepID=UPI0020077047|nr:uncharacterized protein F4812DRAFT_106113 [Daldinia caldariorum]KAI1465674.1 hypothetical protein F4812DRAFT_106113 [Daldinia caldariorum]
MKFTQVALGVAALMGVTSAAKSYIDLSNGLYTIPVVNGSLDFESAVRDWDGVTELNKTDKLAARRPPGPCEPQFPTRKTLCRSRMIKRAEYLRAYAKFIDWIESGPDGGWIPKGSCKSLLWGNAVVSACSTGGVNPTCRAELEEAMREVDSICSAEQGGDIVIRHWAKSYGRHNVRDGDNLDGGDN